jgi:hypothetical protein
VDWYFFRLRVGHLILFHNIIIEGIPSMMTN